MPFCMPHGKAVCGKPCRSPTLSAWCQQVFGVRLSVTERDATQKDFVVQQGRWVVERPLAWLGRYRRLSKVHNTR
jgi:transposase